MIRFVILSLLLSSLVFCDYVMVETNVYVPLDEKVSTSNKTDISTTVQKEIPKAPIVEVHKASNVIKPKKYIRQEVNLVSSVNKTSFWQLLDKAMIQSAALILKRHDVKITKANLAILKSEYYPNISLTYFNEYYHGFSRSGSTNIGGSVYPSNSEYRNSLNLNMDYEIYRFGASDLKMAMANIDINIVKSEISLEKERIAKELLQNYTVALKSQESIIIKNEMLLVKDTLLNNTVRLYDAGFASRVDISRLRIDKVTIEKDILRARLHILDALKNIYIISNVDINATTMNLALLELGSVGIEKFEDTARAKNLRLQIDKKIQEIELIKKEYFPTLYAKSSYQIYGGDKNNVFDAIGELERNNWNVGITLKWDIFNGFKTDNTIEKAKLEIEKLVEQYRLEDITFKARKEKRVLLREMVDKIIEEEKLLLQATSRQKDLLSRLQKSGDLSMMEVDKTEITRLQNKLDFELEVIDQISEDILSQLIM